MQGGLFLLLCLIALMIGARARNSKYQKLSEKDRRRKEFIKKIVTWSALILVIAFSIVFVPFVIQDVRIAIDTHFELETYLSITLLLFGAFTIYTIIKSLK